MNRTRKAKASKANFGEEVAVPENQIETPAALLNDVVLQNIFKYLGYKDLKSVREVKNTVWLRNSRNAWWSRTKVTLAKDWVEVYLTQTELHSCAKNFRLEYFGKGEYTHFWEYFGHSIKYLVLDCCGFGSASDFRQTISTKCPNLEKLEINVNPNVVAVEPLEWQESQFGQQKNLKFLKLNLKFGRMPLSLMEMLSHFPNLEGLETNTKMDIWKVISTIRHKDPRMLKLKHIEIQGVQEMENEGSLRLVLLDPSLSFETLRIANGIDRMETLVDILDLHAKSLKELSISGGIAQISTKISLRQPLLHLKELYLAGCFFTADILRCTPNLRKTHLCFYSFAEASNFLKCADLNMRFECCKELTFNMSHQSKDSDLEFFLNAFPNVEILEISGLNNEKFSMICERWTKLISFKAFESEVDVFGLLGFDPDYETKQARNSNILHLKDLQTFLIGANPFRGELIYGKNCMEMKIKNCDIVRKELEALRQLKKFELWNYQMEDGELWEQLFVKLSGCWGQDEKINFLRDLH